MKRSIVGKMIILFCVVICVSFSIISEGDIQNSPDKLAQEIPASISESFMEVAENESLILSVDIDTAMVAVSVKSTGDIWYSNPVDLNDNENILESISDKLKAQITVTYMSSIRTMAIIDSYNGSVKYDSYGIKRIKNGIKITYDFPDQNLEFRIPIQIALDDNTLVCNVLYEEIEEYGLSQISTISLLPHFGAGSQGEKGYVFVPDGSGALIDFENNNCNSAEYSKVVYGDDLSKNLLLKAKEHEENILMPVFGVKKGNSAFLAVLENGHEDATINVSYQRFASPYISAYSAFIYKHSDQTGIADREFIYRTTQVISQPSTMPSAGLRYYFLHGDQANYSGMASVYREYLIRNYSLEKRKNENPSVSLEFFGMTYKQSSFMGIPYKKAVIATTFDQAQLLMTDITRTTDVKANIILYGFEKGGYDKNSTSANWDKRLGGEKGFKSFVNAVGENKVYVARNIIRDYNSTFLLFKRNRYVSSLGKQTVERGIPLLNTGVINDKHSVWNLFTRDMISETSEKLLNRVSSVYPGIVYSHMGEEVYSDFDDTVIVGRDKLIETYKNILSQSKEKLNHVGGENGSAYLLAGADFIYEVPLTSTPADFFSCSIPFYSMVLHGYVDLSASPINNQPDIKTALLRGLESGISPTFRLTGNDPKELTLTNLGFLYNSNAELWKDMIPEVASQYSDLYKGLYNQVIIEHEYIDDLSVTTFENGTIIIVNYDENPKVYQDTMVDSKSAVRIG